MIRWLYPGMRVKRWFILSLIGVILLVCGLFFILGSSVLSRITYWVYCVAETLAEPNLQIAGFALIVVGLFIIYLGLQRVINSIFLAVKPDYGNDLADALFSKRVLEKGPRIVALGGGTGLSTLLRGLKEFTSNITAVVTMADDGGSSGRLRSDMGILPPGDIRNCLVALADCEPITQSLFQYRFKDGEGLGGHNFGNLFIAVLTKVAGNFETALYYSSKILAVRGRVLPSTLTNCTLVGEDNVGHIVEGESRIPQQRGSLSKVSLRPSDCNPHPDALSAIAGADLVILGPGSLYTSIIPNLLVKGVADAIRESRALKFYICNIMTQPGETDNYNASHHLEAITKHAGENLVDYVIVNNEIISAATMQRYEKELAYQVVNDLSALKKQNVTVIEAPLLDENAVARHDSKKLGQLIMELLLRFQGGRENPIIRLLPTRGWARHDF